MSNIKLRRSVFKLTNIITFLVVIVFLLPSCLEDDITSESSVMLDFSTDTLRFDTVFTTIGSATRSFRILNAESQDVIVSSVSLESGTLTKFRLNVDGIASNEVQNIRIPANDSIWVFAEVTIDPDQPISISPFIIQENLLVSINGNQQKVVLEAWGQNANYITSRDSVGGFSVISCDQGVIKWDDPKPYIIYGVAVIHNCLLSILPGTRIHVHGGFINDGGSLRNDGFLRISPTASIRAQGTFDSPIVFQGDRLESEFGEVEGQWGGLLIDAASHNNVLDYVEIKNSVVGVRTDSLTQLDINNSKIYNTSGSGILSRFSIVDISNSLIHSNNVHAWKITFGGNYSANHCTFANYINSDPSIILTDATCRDKNEIGQCTRIETRPLQIEFINTVIAGNEKDEFLFLINADDPGDFDIKFTNCAIQLDENANDLSILEAVTANSTNCQIINNQSTVFNNEDRLDFHPDSLSILNNAALFDQDLLFDLDFVKRQLDSTDIGCFEFVSD